MKSSSYRFLKILLVVAISIVALSIVAAKIISGYLEKTITEKLAHVHCTIDSLDVDLFARSIRASNFSWTFQDDSAHHAPHQVQISRISLVGISMIRWWLYHELHISKIEGEEGQIIYNQLLKTNKKAELEKNIIDNIQIDELVFSKIRVKIMSDTLPEYSATIAVTLRTIRAENINTNKNIHYEISSVEALAEHIVIQGKASLYQTTINRAYLNSKDGKIDIDSLRMNPLRGKYEFANSLGRQKTRVVLQIPSIRMAGFDYEALRDSIFSVSTTELHDADLSVFRDKRLPFKNPMIPLPMQMLKDEIPFGLKLDTIMIFNSTIAHEEIAEAGKETGKINITNLDATISNFNNRLFDDRPAFAVITAKSRFMQTGLIEASFFMPVKPGINYEAIGNISHLNLQEINTITEAVGFLRIESGFMHKLNFNFSYNEYKSTGVLDINYENLKMVSLNKKDKKINQFKTFILNALVKKNKDKNTPKEQRTGKVNIERDRRRFVVNLWVMSLFDGLKSAVLPDTQEETQKK